MRHAVCTVYVFVGYNIVYIWFSWLILYETERVWSMGNQLISHSFKERAQRAENACKTSNILISLTAHVHNTTKYRNMLQVAQTTTGTPAMLTKVIHGFIIVKV